MALNIVSIQRDGWQIVSAGSVQGLTCPTCRRLATYLWYNGDLQQLACGDCRWPKDGDAQW